MDDTRHTPVLAAETAEILSPAAGETFVDCTVGRGGHAALFAAAIGAAGRVVAFDLDADNLAAAGTRVERLGVPFQGFHDSFARAPRRLRESGLAADVVLADLGISSSQLDDPARGFSFRHDGPLDMRFDRAEAGGRATRGRALPTAADLIARLDEASLERIIREYGEEPLAGKIARKLVRSRDERPIVTTAQLVDQVLEAYGSRAKSSRMHPATRTFMALRIAVNGELDALAALLDAIARGAGEVEVASRGGWLRPGARVGLISFHSLEDRMVKRVFADMSGRGVASRLTKRPVTASPVEIAANARARSARLRAVRLAGAGEGGAHSGPSGGRPLA